MPDDKQQYQHLGHATLLGDERAAAERDLNMARHLKAPQRIIDGFAEHFARINKIYGEHVTRFSAPRDPRDR